MMALAGTRTNVDIWVPTPHGKLVKARLTDVIVGHYGLNGHGGLPWIERIIFKAASGKLRAAP